MCVIILPKLQRMDNINKLIRRVCGQWAFQRIQVKKQQDENVHILSKKQTYQKVFYVLHYIINIFSGIVLVVASPPFLLTHFPIAT